MHLYFCCGALEYPLAKDFVFLILSEAKNIFKSMLKYFNVESDWMWEQVFFSFICFFILIIRTLSLMVDIKRKIKAMRIIINAKRYTALKTLGEKKQAFSEV